MTEPARSEPDAVQRVSLASRLVRHAQLVLLGGLLGLAPVFALAHVAGRARLLAAKLSAPLKWLLPDAGLGQEGWALVMDFAVVVLVCWAFGLFIVRTTLGQAVKVRLETVLLRRTSVFDTYLKVTGQSEDPTALHPALARLQGTWQPAAIVEWGEESGWATVLVVDLPSLQTGRLAFLPPEDVKALDLPMEEFKAKLQGLGRGATHWHELLAGPAD